MAPVAGEVWWGLTLCLNLQGGPDQGEERGIERHRAVAVQRHVHGDQPLWGRKRGL